MNCYSKTTCFTLTKIPSTTHRDVHDESKTTCFTRRDNSVRLGKNITLINNLTFNILSRIM